MCVCLYQSDIADYDRYTLAKSYLDLQEYDRAAHFTKSCRSHKAYFIHVYARYLACEKRRVDDAVDAYGESLVYVAGGALASGFICSNSIYVCLSTRSTPVTKLPATAESNSIHYRRPVTLYLAG